MDNYKNQSIQAARGIACLGIILYHYTTHYNESFPSQSLPFTMIGLSSAVSFFFILSSFYLYKNALKVTTARTLIYKRMIRLYPEYWGSVIITSIVLFILKSHLLKPLWMIIGNLTMINSIFGIKAVDGVYWTLVYELILLAILSLAVNFKVNIKGNKMRLIDNPFILCLTWFLLSCFGQLVKYLLNNDSSSIEALLFGSKYSHIFIIGIIFSCMQKKKKTWHYIMLALCVLYAYVIRESEFIRVLLILISTWLLLNNNLNFINLKVFRKIGDISYPLYLLHSMVGKAIIIKLGEMGWVHWTNTIVPFIISIILAYSVHYFGQKIITLIKTKFDTKFIKQINNVIN